MERGGGGRLGGRGTERCDREPRAVAERSACGRANSPRSLSHLHVPTRSSQEQFLCSGAQSLNASGCCRPFSCPAVPCDGLSCCCAGEASRALCPCHVHTKPERTCSPALKLVLLPQRSPSGHRKLCLAARGALYVVSSACEPCLAARV